jgi:Bacterial extracellular solute-binding proteins, family 3
VMPEIRPEYLEGKKVGAIAGSAHEAYLKAMFTDAELHSYPNDEALRLALRRGEVDFIFGDGISLAFWINGTDSADCCAFSGGPFVESRFFGEGVGIGVRKGNDLLRQALNWALFRVWEKGRYTDLWLRYFSVSPFSLFTVIPGQSSGLDPESRDSGFDASAFALRRFGGLIVRRSSRSERRRVASPRNDGYTNRSFGETYLRCPRSIL